MQIDQYSFKYLRATIYIFSIHPRLKKGYRRCNEYFINKISHDESKNLYLLFRLLAQLYLCYDINYK